MPSWVSKLGKWVPRKEYHVDPNAPQGVNPVHDGPDRAASEVLAELGVDHLGQDYHLNPDLIRASRELGYKSVDAYLKEMFGFDPAVAIKKSEELVESKVDQRKSPQRIPATKQAGGGVDTSGQGASRYGDFGTPPELSGKMKE